MCVMTFSAKVPKGKEIVLYKCARVGMRIANLREGLEKPVTQNDVSM